MAFHFGSLCPVCDTGMKRERDVDEGRLLEAYEDCDNGCYHYRFAYGNWEYWIGGKLWEGNWQDDGDADPFERRDWSELLRMHKDVVVPIFNNPEWKALLAAWREDGDVGTRNMLHDWMMEHGVPQEIIDGVIKG